MSGGKDLMKAKLARGWIIVAVGLATLSGCVWDDTPSYGGYFPAYAGTAYPYAYPGGSLGLGGVWIGGGHQHNEWHHHGEWHHHWDRDSAPHHQWHGHQGDWSGGQPNRQWQH